MKKIIKYNFYLLLVAGFIACNNKSGDNKLSQESADTTVSTRWVWPDSIKNELHISDSTLQEMGAKSLAPWESYTPSQMKLCLDIYKITYEYMVVEDNRYVFKMSREDFLKTGIPEPYYDWILSSIRDNNEYFDKHPEVFADSLDRLWHRTKENDRIELLKMEKKLK